MEGSWMAGELISRDRLEVLVQWTGPDLDRHTPVYMRSCSSVRNMYKVESCINLHQRIF